MSVSRQLGGSGLGKAGQGWTGQVIASWSLYLSGMWWMLGAQSPTPSLGQELLG
jgi:hypothetical protein